MRRIVIIIVLVVVVGFAGYMLLRPKRPAGRSRSATADTTGSTAARPARGRGRTAGRLKATSKEELKAEKAKQRKEERRRKRELKRQEREKRRRLKAASRGRKGKRSSKRRRGGQLYTVSAIISLGSESYALVDGRRVGIGDVVMGRRIVAIMPDRLEVEAFGRMMTVRVGESLLPSSYYDRRRRG